MTTDRHLFIRGALASLGFSVLAAMAGPAAAHAHLIASLPVANAVTASPGTVSIQFSEKLISHFSGFDLLGPDGQKVSLKVLPSTDANGMSAQVPHTLKPGTYQVKWHAVGEDAHRMEGQFGFQVR